LGITRFFPGSSLAGPKELSEKLHAFVQLAWLCLDFGVTSRSLLFGVTGFLCEFYCWRVSSTFSWSRFSSYSVISL